MQAQRPARTDVTQYPDIPLLATGIDSWLDSHDDVLFSHGDPAQTAIIHNTANFLPWHRVHIRELEDYLIDLGTFSAGQILPRWRPRANAGEPGNPIPAAMQFTNSGEMGVANPDPISPIFPSTIIPPAACTNYAVAALFSNDLQDNYHDNTHGLVGDDFGPLATSATVLGFWPWHAWVDEFWYDWENCSTAGYTRFPAPGTTEMVYNSPVTWSGEEYVKGRVVIENGGVLTIAPGSNVHFRSSDYEAYETAIIVKPGGRLVVDGATLTGIDYFGPSSLQIRYNSGWKGILVEGTGTFNGNHGKVYVRNNAVIEHASVGIESVNGGRIIATNSDFLNNRISIHIRDFSHPNFYHYFIQGCDFDVTGALRDVSWTPDGGLPRRHFRHGIPETPERYILLENAKTVTVIGGSFKRSFVADSDDVTIAIESSNSQLSCSGAVIDASVTLGILVFNTVGGPIGGVTVQNCPISSESGILLNGSDYATITSNAFDNKHYGIYAQNSSAYDISDDNTFDGVQDFGCVVSEDSEGNYANIIERNTFNSDAIHIQFQVSNPDVQFRCNAFNNVGGDVGSRSVHLSSGTLPDQGNCLSIAAGNVWDNFGCTGDQSQLSRSTINSSGYKYNTHNDLVPMCVSSGITVFPPCSYSSAENAPCQSEPPCPTCPPYPEESRIAALEAEKQNWAGSALPPAEIAAIVWQLTWEQKIIAQRGLLQVMEADSTLATAFDYLEEVGEVFPFPASDRIGLYLRDGNLAAANNLINTLPAGNEKTLLTLHSILRAEGRSFKQLTQAEEQTVRTIAQGDDQAAAQAKSLLYAAFGERIVINPEPLDGERSTPENVENTTQLSATPSLVFLPNPSSDAVSVQYTLNTTGQYGNFILTDLCGRQVLAQPFAADTPTGQLRVDLSSFPSGTYAGTIMVDGLRQLVSKLAIVK
ncbi:MAG: hypothetical protein EPGJADBJ_03583 [Saprospiraceae bacterium]|nr:hypothetical protein [Saprospiraceae bacterium]